MAHAPKSMPLQRSLQNGRYAFCELNKLGPPQVGQGTWRGLDKGSLIGVSQRGRNCLRGLGAECHFEGGVFFAGQQLTVFLLLHEANHYQQTVAADLGCEVQAVVNAQSQQLKVTTLR